MYFVEKGPEVGHILLHEEDVQALSAAVIAENIAGGDIQVVVERLLGLDHDAVQVLRKLDDGLLCLPRAGAEHLIAVDREREEENHRLHQRHGQHDRQRHPGADGKDSPAAGPCGVRPASSIIRPDGIRPACPCRPHAPSRFREAAPRFSAHCPGAAKTLPAASPADASAAAAGSRSGIRGRFHRKCAASA